MKSDSVKQSAGGPAGGEIDRAHLAAPTGNPFTIGRWPAEPDVDDLVRRFWVPVWDVPGGGDSTQRVLQYPTCLIVVSPSYARFYGVVRGLSSTTLSGRGWAVGVMLRPAAGSLVLGGQVRPWTDRFGELSDVLGPSATELVATVRRLMTPNPDDEAAQHAATDAVQDWLRPLLPADEEGLLINAIVEDVENDPDLLRVEELARRWGLTERSLQRLVSRRLGLTPKWLIQRRRLHEAAARLRWDDDTVATVAADLGYADEAHLVRDFRTVTGTTPGAFAREHRAVGQGE